MPVTWYGMVCAVCWEPIEDFTQAILLEDNLLDVHPGLCSKIAGLLPYEKHMKWDNESGEMTG